VWCSFLSEDSAVDLKKKLRQMGYSGKTAEEILKWYGANISQADEPCERNLRSSNLRQQKRNH
jgi:hypothetical protein